MTRSLSGTRTFMIAASVCAVLAGTSTVFAAGSTAPTVSRTSYFDALRTAARALEAASRTRKPLVPELHVPPAPLPGPPRYSPSLDEWLQAMLRAAREEKQSKPRAHLLRVAASALRSAIVIAQAGAATPKDPIRTTVAAILAQPAYHEHESSQQAEVHKSWWQRFIEWLADTFSRLLQGISNAAGGVPFLGQILAVAVIALIAALVLLLGYRIARYVLSLRRARASDYAGEVIEPGEQPDSLYARARAAAAAGRFAAAVALVFRAGLLQLDKGGFIPYDAARTAGEYRRTVRRACAPAAAPFDAMARSFTLAAYAESPVDESDWRGADDAYRTFRPIVDAPRAPASTR